MARLALRVLPLAIAAIAAPSAVRADPSMVLSVGPFGGLLGGAGALQGGGGVEASLLRFNRPMSRDAFLVGGVAQLAGFVRNSEGTLYGMLGGEIAYGGAGIEAGAYGQSAGGGYGASVGVHLGAFLSLGVLYVSGGVHVPVVQAVAPDPLGVQGFLFIGAKYPITVRGDDPYASLFNFSFGRGRPLVRDDAPVIAAREASASWLDGRATDLAGLDAATRAALARAWLDDARAEHASIAAFTRLSMQLLAAGAPPDLLAETHRAAIDEVRHAQRCFTLASAYGAAPEAPGGLSIEAIREAPCDLATIAREALLDGCVGEGVAAVVARASSDDARDPEVRETLAVIADDERRHAALAWSVLSWCLDAGGAGVAEALCEALRALGERDFSMGLPEGVDAAAWVACGRMVPSQVEALYEAVTREAAARVWGLPAMIVRVTALAPRRPRRRGDGGPHDRCAGAP